METNVGHGELVEIEDTLSDEVGVNEELILILDVDPQQDDMLNDNVNKDVAIQGELLEDQALKLKGKTAHQDDSVESDHVPEEATEEEISSFKCLICLEPAENNRLIESADLASTFVVIATKSRSKHFSVLPKKAFTDGLKDGWYCNACFNRLHQLNFLHNKIKTLQENLIKLELEIENEIITTYYKEGDCPDENESKKVLDLRRRFYKISVKAIPVKIEPEVIVRLEAESITVTPQIDPLSEEEEQEDGEPWTPNPADLQLVERNLAGKSSASRPRTRNFMKSPLKCNAESHKNSGEDSCPKAEKVATSSKSRSPQKRRRKKGKTKPVNEEGSESDEVKPKKTRKRATKSDDTIFQCTFTGCSQSFSLESHRYVHIKKVHEGLDKPHSCEECGKCYRTPSKLRVHRRSHSGETPYTCEYCGKSFMASWYLKQHVRMHNGQFICSICGKRAVSRFNLEAHMNTHSNMKPFVCEVCGEGFATKQYLQFHQANKHEGTTDREPCQCSVCDRRFSSNTALRNHKMSAHQIGEPKYRCDVCNSAWNNKRELRMHYTVVHLNERKFECDICHKKCSTMNNVRVHKERQHWAKEDRPRPFKCTVCERAFFIKKTLENHMALHSGARPYACTQCDKSFPSKSYLNLHVYTIHDKRQRKTPAPPPNEKDTTVKHKIKPKKKTPVKPQPTIIEVAQSPPAESVEVITLASHENPPISVHLAGPYGSYYNVYHQYPDNLSFQIIE